MADDRRLANEYRRLLPELDALARRICLIARFIFLNLGPDVDRAVAQIRRRKPAHDANQNRARKQNGNALGTELLGREQDEQHRNNDQRRAPGGHIKMLANMPSANASKPSSQRHRRRSKDSIAKKNRPKIQVTNSPLWVAAFFTSTLSGPAEKRQWPGQRMTNRRDQPKNNAGHEVSRQTPTNRGRNGEIARAAAGSPAA